MSGGHSLRRRLILVMLLVFAFGVLASLASYRLEVHKLGDSLREQTLQEQAREALAALRVDASGAPRLALTPAWERAYADASGTFAYTVYGRDRRPAARSPNLAAPLPYIAVPAGADFAPIGLVGVGVGAVERAATAVRGPGGAVIVVARRRAGFDRLVDSLFEENSEQLFILAPFAVLAIGLIWLVSGWSLRPLTRASREAASVGTAAPGLRISAAGLPREIRPLVGAVNGALDRLADAFAAERRMTADAAHALRTPLAVLSLRLQRARQSGAADWQAVERDLGHLTAIVGQLLDLARKESQAQRGGPATLPLVNLARLAREAAAAVTPLVESRGRRLKVEIPDRLPLHGRADDLRDLVRNLLDNALTHGGGTVTLTLGRDRASPGRIVLEVADEGGGVPSGMEESVFARFHKLDGASAGAGLGLAIVRQVARSHGGDARFARGRGSVTVTLPAAAEAAPLPALPEAAHA